jgi:hypothetical protein
MNERVKEEIKYYTEWLRFLIVFVFSVGGFAVNVFFSTENKYTYKYVLVLSAIFLIFAAVVFIFKLNQKTHKKLKTLC